jgi:hypothetical protein
MSARSLADAWARAGIIATETSRISARKLMQVRLFIV